MQGFMQTLKPKPSPIKKDLQEKRITLGAAAVHVNRSYPYFCNMVNGIAPMPPDVEAKLRELIKSVEGDQRAC